MSIARLAPAGSAVPLPPEGSATDFALAAQHAAPELAVVVPTLNERDNVPVVVERLNKGLSRVGVGASFLKAEYDRPSGVGEGGVEFVARMVIRLFEDDGGSSDCLLVEICRHTRLRPLPNSSKS